MCALVTGVQTCALPISALLRAEDSWLRVFAAEERHGKSHGMNTLVQAAQGDVVVFTDANVTVDPAALAALRRSFADPIVGCVCGHLVYTNGDEGATAAVGSFYWRLRSEEHTSELQSLMRISYAFFCLKQK